MKVNVGGADRVVRIVVGVALIALALAGTIASFSIIPRILQGKGPDGAIRVWSAGCASGEEVYSLAVLLCDAVGLGFFELQRFTACDCTEAAWSRADVA